MGTDMIQQQTATHAAFGRAKQQGDFQILQRSPLQMRQQLFSEAIDYLHLFHYEHETTHP